LYPASAQPFFRSFETKSHSSSAEAKKRADTFALHTGRTCRLAKPKARLRTLAKLSGGPQGDPGQENVDPMPILAERDWKYRLPRIAATLPTLRHDALYATGNLHFRKAPDLVADGRDMGTVDFFFFRLSGNLSIFLFDRSWFEATCQKTNIKAIE